MHQDKQLCVCLSSHSPAAMKPWQSRKLKKKRSFMRTGWGLNQKWKHFCSAAMTTHLGLRPITLEAVVSCHILWGEQRNTLRVLLMDKSVCLIHTDPLFMVNPPSTGLNLHTRTCTHTHNPFSHSLTQLPHRTRAILLTPPESRSGPRGRRGQNLQARSWPFTLMQELEQGAERCLCF